MSRHALIAGVSSFILLLGVALGGYALFSKDYLYVKVRGSSMAPLLHDGDGVILKKVKTPPEPDQILIFNLPEEWKETWKGDDETQLIKRVALVPGDKLSWDGMNWYRNGEQFSGLLNGSCKVDPMETTIGEGQYFVTGDTTQGQTLDSREAFCLGLPYLVDESHIEEVAVISRIIG